MTQLHLEEQLRAVYDALSQLSQSLIIINCLLLHRKPGRLNNYQLLGATRHAGGTGRNIRTVLQRTTTRGAITDSSTADGAYLDRYAQAWHTCTTSTAQTWARGAASNPEGRTWEVLPSAKLIVVFRPLSSYNLSLTCPSIFCIPVVYYLRLFLFLSYLFCCAAYLLYSLVLYLLRLYSSTAPSVVSPSMNFTYKVNSASSERRAAL